MPPLRERLWGKTKPLREKLAEAGKTALEVASGRIVPNTIGRALTNDDSEAQKKKDEEINQAEIRGQVDLNARMGYHSDALGNITSKIEGFKQSGSQALTHEDKSDFERTLEQLPGAMRDTVLGWADKVKNAGKVTYTRPPEENVAAAAEAVLPHAQAESKFDRTRFQTGVAYNESRGTPDPYKAIGPTKDLGKYQASPATLKAWSKAWLGKQYTPEEFLNDPDAQERFFNEFMNVAERLDLTDEEAAVAWHRGWGQLGVGSKDTRDKRFRETLSRMMDEDISQKYLTSFKEGLSQQTQP